MSKVADTFAGGQDRGCPQDSNHTESFPSSSSSGDVTLTLEEQRLNLNLNPALYSVWGPDNPRWYSNNSDFGSGTGNSLSVDENGMEEYEEDSNTSGELISMSVVIYSLK